jgi:hypothetical protein
LHLVDNFFSAAVLDDKSLAQKDFLFSGSGEFSKRVCGFMMGMEGKSSDFNVDLLMGVGTLFLMIPRH